jgi:hypothetical protein
MCGTPAVTSLLLYMCPHTTTTAALLLPPRCCYICVLILLYVLILQYMCPHTATSAISATCRRACTALQAALRLYVQDSAVYVSSYCSMCPHTTIYVSSYPLHVGGHVRHCRRHCAIGEIDIANIGKRCAIANCRVTKKVFFLKKVSVCVF